ncbi:hypothetical protein G6F56_012526 [Rhizopus delemar]|nr:hypothetical protein G6F56_012526 [Rhizopus delemar]
MVAGPNGKLRTPPLADRLTSLVRYLFVDQCGVEPTQTYLEESGRALRSTARDTYKVMRNDGHSPVKPWGSYSDDDQMYYALLLESFAMRRGINAYRCRKQWVARGLLSERCKTSKQTTNRRRVQEAKTAESQRKYGNLEDVDRVVPTN